MDRSLKSLILITLLGFSLSACETTKQKNNSNYAMCKELKHQIIFNGSTYSDVEAQNERANLDNLSRTYRDECS